MGKNLRIRCAQSKDLPWIVEELKSFSVFYKSKIPLFPTEEYALAGMQSHLDNHVLLVAEDDSGLLGFISGIFSTHIFNPKIKLLNETFWWVAERNRFTRAGLMLLDAFTEIGKKSADWTVFTLEHHSPVNDRSLLKRGYEIKETNYLMENV
jgi:hypothetical protein